MSLISFRPRVPAYPHVRLFPTRSSRSSLRTTIASRFPNSVNFASRYPLHLRTMSSAPAKKEFLCILPDKPGTMAKRIEVRPAHLEGVKPHVASGAIVAGGAMLNSHPAEGESPSFKGSMMMAVAENEAEVRELLSKDIYTVSGVWDMKNAQIIPGGVLSCRQVGIHRLVDPRINQSFARPFPDESTPPQTAMAPESTPPKGGGMMSLYANLLDPPADSPGTISRAPVVFKRSFEDDAQPDESAAKKQQLNPASLRFQPTKRPQLAAQKPKAKPTLPKAMPQPAPDQTSAPTAAPVKSTLADWAATEDDDFEYYMGEKRQRGGRKKRKKNREPHAVPQNWDDIYDPSRPNNYEEYRHSDEKILEVREWKDRLYAHRMRRSLSGDSDSEDYDRPMNRQFAPPSSFAPPPNLNSVPPPPASVPDDASGEDAFARRMRMGQNTNSDMASPDYTQPPPPPPPEEPPAPLPDDNTGDEAYMRRLQRTNNQPTVETAPPPPPSRPLDSFQPSSATIFRAPVRYTLPPPPEEIPASEAELEAVLSQEQPTENEPDEDAPRSLRPGQKGFAERLLSKYGWTKGSGLGASGEGIVKPLQVKVEKQKKRPDSEGGGFATPAGRGKIIGGKKKGSDEGKFGPMSEVIILRGMLDGMDLETELNAGQDGGLMQEIGEECSEKYGSVERVFIARDIAPPVPVFVKFTSPLSALRAVNALEGRIFNGNAISARFFEREKFEQGIYVD
ncbi:hypothetical protein NUU61_009816 [Penicillium alfredii]|uniref:G-patch domain-containing protein n=1 Tax=Penicillium alfredii TaxID=1506179 RepID=A0A9W9EGT7_9EURO|nr:uncharacterized protein NUU61_009816 [Penicillium alfredii]KAJ5081552.1 hypothetical protein NUU61_009816 [Penicillium alfredii]